MRPGPLSGSYVERAEPRHGKPEQFVRSLLARSHQLAVRRRFNPKGLLAGVEGHTQGLAACSDMELSARIEDCRRDLFVGGLTRDNLSVAFALIREAAERTLGLRYFDVQILGAYALLNGRLAEMETGEGKSFTATLAAAIAAMAGLPVHVITVNDYLVTRDVEEFLPLYNYLEVTAAAITEAMDIGERQTAYNSDVVYVSNKQLAFDYLRDRISLGNERNPLRLGLERLHEDNPRTTRLFLRGLSFCIVDEADSVLIDEARTPLIIARETDNASMAHVLDDALEIANLLEEKQDFIRRQKREIELTNTGSTAVDRYASARDGIWQARRRREGFVVQALQALHCYQRDRDYLIKDGKVQIIDEYTGRVMPDRSWEFGLHQMIEAKERCEITGQQETQARITYQRFFQRFHHISGMTGTANEVRGEVNAVYGLKVVNIATNRKPQRGDLGLKVFRTSQEKWHHVVEHVVREHASGRPVLVGTRSVEISEFLSNLLTAANIQHNVLNARQDAEEAAVIAAAGRKGQVTVATNMAGRGTDIKLGNGAAEVGGLMVLATELHESRRIDRQLFGRAARQGEPGESAGYAALDDDLFVQHASKLSRRMSAMLPGPMGRAARRGLGRWCQYKAGHKHAAQRKQLAKIETDLAERMGFSTIRE